MLSNTTLNRQVNSALNETEFIVNCTSRCLDAGENAWTVLNRTLLIIVSRNLDQSKENRDKKETAHAIGY